MIGFYGLLNGPSTGTGIQLFGNVTQSISYNLTLDGQTNGPITTFSPSDATLLASYTNLTASNHTLSLVVVNPTGDSENLLAFDRAVILVNQTDACVSFAPCQRVDGLTLRMPTEITLALR